MLRRKFGAIMLALTFVLASAYIADADIGGGKDRQLVQVAHRGVPINDRDADSGGAMDVDRDLYPFHSGDINQFGDDEAYNSANGRTNRKVPFPIHREDK